MEADSVRPLVDLDGNITFIHDTVMECVLGRKDSGDEIVYKLDGDVLNNQSGNLAIRFTRLAPRASEQALSAGSIPGYLLNNAVRLSERSQPRFTVFKPACQPFPRVEPKYLAMPLPHHAHASRRMAPTQTAGETSVRISDHTSECVCPSDRPNG